MIDPKELRIGNFIFDDEGALVRVVGFSPHYHSCRCDEPEGCAIIFDIYSTDGQIRKGYENESDSCHPIELTSEWLNKFGFEKVKEDIYRIFIGDTIIGIALTANKENICMVGDFEIVHYLPNKIKDVHSLMNVYYWLTGEELSLKSFNQSN